MFDITECVNLSLTFATLNGSLGHDVLTLVDRMVCCMMHAL